MLICRVLSSMPSMVLINVLTKVTITCWLE